MSDLPAPASPPSFEDDFDGSALDTSKWLPAYLPHWSTPEAARPRYEVADGRLRLFVADDQPPWCPEFDGDVRVSNVQTGHWSGPVGSAEGQHRFRSGLVVRSALPPRRLYVPMYGRLDMKARARLNPWNLAALWLIGFEDSPDRCGEITVFEAFGKNVSAHTARIGRGIKAIRDERLRDEISEGELALSVEDWHVYTMDWTPGGVDFYVDGRLVTRTAQSPGYPMQLMLNFYDLPDGSARIGARQAWFDIDYIRAWDWHGV